MSSLKKVRVEATWDGAMGRELLEDELAAICGGSSGATDPTGMGPWDPSGLSTLTNLLSPQKAAAGDKTNTPGGPPDLGPLSNLAGGLMSKLF